MTVRHYEKWLTDFVYDTLLIKGANGQLQIQLMSPKVLFKAIGITSAESINRSKHV